jgi:cell division inhibitor SepF
MAGLWRRTMVYLGLVDDEFDEYDEYEPAPANRSFDARHERADTRYADGRYGDTRLGEARYGYGHEASRADTGRYDNGRDVSGIGAVRTIPREDTAATSRPTVVRTVAATPKVHVVEPTGFNDAQEVGDRLKAGQPVILNLQGLDRSLQRRLVDFASGLAYALNGQMTKAADQVFLLAPANVEVSQEEKARLRTRGLYRDDT